MRCEARSARAGRRAGRDRVLAYQAARGIALDGMGVIIQRQIAPSLSGVLFTLARRSRRDADRVLRRHGRGARLGRVNPGRVLDPQARRRQSAALACADGRRPRRRRSAPQSVPAERSPASRNWPRLALGIERAFGAPQDIEWTLDGDGRLWIVQSRGRSPRQPRSRRQTSDSSERSSGRTPTSTRTFRSRSRPLLYSIARAGYYHYFRNLGLAFGLSRRRLAAMEQPLRQIIGVHGARMYYNLTSIHAVLRVGAVRRRCWPPRSTSSSAPRTPTRGRACRARRRAGRLRSPGGSSSRASPRRRPGSTCF